MALGSWADTPLFPRASAEQFMKSRIREEMRSGVETDLLPKGPSKDIMILD